MLASDREEQWCTFVSRWENMYRLRPLPGCPGNSSFIASLEHLESNPVPDVKRLWRQIIQDFVLQLRLARMRPNTWYLVGIGNVPNGPAHGDANGDRLDGGFRTVQRIQMVVDMCFLSPGWVIWAMGIHPEGVSSEVCDAVDGGIGMLVSFVSMDTVVVPLSGQDSEQNPR